VVTIGEPLREWRHRQRMRQLGLALVADISARQVSLVQTARTSRTPRR
jgi:hypothetical protein